MSVTVTDASGRTLALPADSGATLSQLVFLSGHWPAQPVCSGLGRCGRCKVRFLSDAPAPAEVEEQVLGVVAIQAGWRLGCRHQAHAGTRIVLPVSPHEELFKAEQSGEELVLAVDLGTTSIQWEALDARGAVVAFGQGLNPQMGAGSEVMSRLAYAQEQAGARRLKTLVLDALAAIVSSLPGPVVRLAVAGNPTMTNLLLGQPLQGLSRAPYHLDYLGGAIEQLDERLPEAYILPQLAPFVGGDLSAGVAALLEGDEVLPRAFLLADMGTNGEFVLVDESGHCLAASVPLGPALEGIGLTFGTTARPGAVTSFSMTPTGLTPHCLGSGQPAADVGMTGTAYLSLCARLLSLGVLDEKGAFQVPRSPLGARVAQSLKQGPDGERLALPGGMWLSALDVEEILKVKAAFNMALSRLTREGGLDAGPAALVLAGAMGTHVDVADLETLGFIPLGLGKRTRAAGNTSLAGARAMLLQPQARHRAQSLRDVTRVIDLTSDPAFGQEFVGRMRFAYLP